jgi:uncharacterized coiled-coil protein SlyX
MRLPFLYIVLVLAWAWFALAPQARAVCQEGCSGSNTFLGEDALLNSTGINNTAVGFDALFSNTSGGANTAIGYQAIFSNTIGIGNTAIGVQALYDNTGGFSDGFFEGSFNTASGWGALFHNTTGNNNTANGFGALVNNTTGGANTAVGLGALNSNTTGNSNIAVGLSAGFNLTTGSNNIDIGNDGRAGESGNIRIGTKGAQTKTFIAGISGVTVANGVGVIINSQGQLGTVVSSERFKAETKPMDKASEAILALQPVTFRYKKELDPEGIPQFGLVAEQVEKVNPNLVARDDEGKPYSVRYEAVNAMLLNEFLKEHRKGAQRDRKIAEQEAKIAELKMADAEQRKEISALTAALKEQAAQIQAVSDQLALSRPAPQMANNNR